MDQGGISYNEWKDNGFSFKNQNIGTRDQKKSDTKMHYVPKKDKRDLVAWAPESSSINQSIKKSF